jgi:hypothetical protein
MCQVSSLVTGDTEFGAQVGQDKKSGCTLAHHCTYNIILPKSARRAARPTNTVDNKTSLDDVPTARLHTLGQRIGWTKRCDRSDPGSHGATTVDNKSERPLVHESV